MVRAGRAGNVLKVAEIGARRHGLTRLCSNCDASHDDPSPSRGAGDRDCHNRSHIAPQPVGRPPDGKRRGYEDGAGKRHPGASSASPGVAVKSHSQVKRHRGVRGLERP